MSKRFAAAAAVSVVAVLGLAGCQPNKAAKPAAGPVKFNTDLPMTEIMGHVVDPAAFMYWKNSGTMVDAKGEHDLSPTTDEGWDVLVSGASILMEAGNVLQLEGRVREPAADWNKYAQLLTERAKAARVAAEKHDKNGTYAEGAKVYEVCVACHEQFVIQPEIKANGPAKGEPLPELPAGAVKK
jgi:hypothetical protein